MDRASTSTSAATAVRLIVGRPAAASASDSTPLYSSFCVRREIREHHFVIYQPPRALMIGDYEAKYRVIYRV